MRPRPVVAAILAAACAYELYSWSSADTDAPHMTIQPPRLEPRHEQTASAAPPPPPSAPPVEATAVEEDMFRVTWRATGHERFDYSAVVDSFFTAEAVRWLAHYRPAAGALPSRGAPLQLEPMAPSEPEEGETPSRAPGPIATSTAAGPTGTPVTSSRDPGLVAARATVEALRLSTERARAARQARAATQRAVKLPPGAARRAGGSWPGDTPPSDGARSVALRTARGTFVSAAMDRERVVQALHLGHAEAFRVVRRKGGAISLRTHYGTCVSVWYDGSVHQNRKCGAWEALRTVEQPGGRTALRTAHDSYLTAEEDERALGHSKQLSGDAQRFELIELALPPEPASPFGVSVRVRASWRRGGVGGEGRGAVGEGGGAGEGRANPGGEGGAWCVEWSRCDDDARRGLPPLLRLCFNASSGTRYWESSAAGRSGLPPSAISDASAATVGGWVRFGEAPLDVWPGEAVDVEVGWAKGMLSHSVRGGWWRSTPSNATLLQLQLSRVWLRSHGARLAALRAYAHADHTLRLLPPFDLPSTKSMNVRGAPTAFDDAKAERGARRFRFLNPSFAGRRKGGVQVLAKVSSHHLCGASDDRSTVGKERGGALLSFVVRLTVALGSGKLVGPITAIAAANAAITRGVQWGDGPEDPRGVRVGGKEVVLLWGRTWRPEVSVFACTRPVAAEGAAAHAAVRRLRREGCESCAQRSWSPFVSGGKLYAEASVEPRLVLRVDTETGVCRPSANDSAPPARLPFPPARALQEATSAQLRPGPPALKLTLPGGRQAFIGLGHFSRPLPGKRALRLYHHVWYVFAPRPPFQLLGIGRPFMFPTELGYVQFASGLLLQRASAGHDPGGNGTLQISFGEQDCEARRAAVALDAVLADVRLDGVGAGGSKERV